MALTREYTAIELLFQLSGFRELIDALRKKDDVGFTESTSFSTGKTRISVDKVPLSFIKKYLRKSDLMLLAEKYPPTLTDDELKDHFIPIVSEAKGWKMYPEYYRLEIEYSIFDSLSRQCANYYQGGCAMYYNC